MLQVRPRVRKSYLSSVIFIVIHIVRTCSDMHFGASTCYPRSCIVLCEFVMISSPIQHFFKDKILPFFFTLCQTYTSAHARVLVKNDHNVPIECISPLNGLRSLRYAINHTGTRSALADPLRTRWLAQSVKRHVRRERTHCISL